MEVREIVSHVAPDLDGLVSVWLLKRFGGESFPGAKDAPVRFLPASAVDGPALEEEGVLAVDVGGGRFDHHYESSQEALKMPDLCASMLVARAMKIDRSGPLKKILDLAQRRDIDGVGVRSSDPLDQAGHLVNLIDGWNGIHPDRPEEVARQVFTCLDALYHNEKEWTDALEMVHDHRSLKFKGTGILVDHLESDNKRLMKASRYRRRDACVIRSRSGNVGVNINFKSDRVELEDVITTATYLRLFECHLAGADPDPETLVEIGNHHGWFLHSSKRLVMAGSDKEPTAPRSALPLERIAELVGVSLHHEHLFPPDVCPGDHCAGECCFLYAHDLPNCQAPRKGGIGSGG